MRRLVVGDSWRRCTYRTASLRAGPTPTPSSSSLALPRGYPSAGWRWAGVSDSHACGDARVMTWRRGAAYSTSAHSPSSSASPQQGASSSLWSGKEGKPADHDDARKTGGEDEKSERWDDSPLRSESPLLPPPEGDEGEGIEKRAVTSDEQREEEAGEEMTMEGKKEDEKSADGEEEKGGVGAAIKNVVSSIAQTMVGTKEKAVDTLSEVTSAVADDSTEKVAEVSVAVAENGTEVVESVTSEIVTTASEVATAVKETVGHTVELAKEVIDAGKDKTLEGAVAQMVKVLKVSVYELVDEGFTKATVSSGVNVMGIVNLNVSVHLEEQMAVHFKRLEMKEKRKKKIKMAAKEAARAAASSEESVPTPSPTVAKETDEKQAESLEEKKAKRPEKAKELVKRIIQADETVLEDDKLLHQAPAKENQEGRRKLTSKAVTTSNAGTIAPVANSNSGRGRKRAVVKKEDTPLELQHRPAK